MIRDYDDRLSCMLNHSLLCLKISTIVNDLICFLNWGIGDWYFMKLYLSWQIRILLWKWVYDCFGGRVNAIEDMWWKCGKSFLD